MADRGFMTNIPIWVRVPGIIGLVLVGIVVGSMLLGGMSGRTGGTEGMDHNGRPTGSAAPSAGPGDQRPSHRSGDPTPSGTRQGH